MENLKRNQAEEVILVLFCVTLAYTISASRQGGRTMVIQITVRTKKPVPQIGLFHFPFELHSSNKRSAQKPCSQDLIEEH